MKLRTFATALALVLVAACRSDDEITTPDLEPFREATQSVYDKHADTIGADLIDAIRNA